ncbi:MAG TPA: 2'-5' RNA ligase family protein [Methanoregulaceae archaeon]|nr:2'-5' RNA ligase family protein [Methanoregulaceae archaeon]
MIKTHRSRHLSSWHRGGQRESSKYFLMIRVNDWKLLKKTDFIRHLVNDIYNFPPFQHITLYGPFFKKSGLQPDALCNAIESACKRSPGFVLKLSGWLLMRGRKGLAIAHDIDTSPAFREFYDILWHSLAPLTESLSWIDRDPLRRRFHISHSYDMRVTDAESVCETIREAIEAKHEDGSAGAVGPGGPENGDTCVLLPEYAPLTVFRVALIENGSVRGEFDMPSGIWLPRALAYHPGRMAVSLKQYRRLSGIELVGQQNPAGTPPFVTSDLHLGHLNIIKYCRRPFSSADEMDEVLINNWNKVVHGDDEILFLGDLRYGPAAAPAGEYLRKLEGRISLIRGNHDEDLPESVSFLEKSFGGLDFLFIHDPAQVPTDFQGWTIHGHAHNNNIGEYPFIDFIHRRVNVSTEMTGYRPVSLKTIHGYILGGRECDRIDMLPLAPPVTVKDQK